MKENLEYIKKEIKEYGNVSIPTEKLTDEEIKVFSKYWRVEKDEFGYTTFYTK